MIPSVVVIGVPDSGKSSFIAALSHILEFKEIETTLTLSRLPDDAEYLHEMRSDWEDCQRFERTKAGVHPITFNLVDKEGRQVDLFFPDIAGEEFDKQWSSRIWNEDFLTAIEHATGVQLPQVLHWIQNHEHAATSLEWTAFLKSHQREFVAWLNSFPNPNLQTIILAANVLDAPPSLHTVLTEATIERLALAVPKLPHERHEVAAFLFATTAWVSQPVLATIFIDSFISLHRAIAQSRLSNRAWQLLASLLKPLPDAEWDSCEKLRRAALHIIFKNGWNFRILARHFDDDIDLFYDFTRTAKSSGEGRDFMARVYDAAQQGELSLGKKQMKELRKLFGKGFW